MSVPSSVNNAVPLGGEMELVAEQVFSCPALAPVWPFPDCRTVKTGRTALLLLARWLQQSTKGLGTILLPSYLCPSIVQAFSGSRNADAVLSRAAGLVH